MRHIPTTRTAVERLKKEAQRLYGPQLPWQAALDQAAQAAGYHHWKHVTECLAASAVAKPTAAMSQIGTVSSATSPAAAALTEIFLRPELSDLLDGSLTNVHNSSTGLVFAEASDGKKRSLDSRIDAPVIDALSRALTALAQEPPCLAADVEVNGMAFCLTLLLPPVATVPSWTIAQRNEVPARAHESITTAISIEVGDDQGAKTRDDRKDGSV